MRAKRADCRKCDNLGKRLLHPFPQTVRRREIRVQRRARREGFPMRVGDASTRRYQVVKSPSERG